MEVFERWFNLRLLSEPMNWAIVFIFATISLLGFHTAVQAFTAMGLPGPAIGAAPGQLAIQSSGTSMFSQPGTLADSGMPDSPAAFQGGAPMIWTDGNESKWAEDGWYGNP